MKSLPYVLGLGFILSVTAATAQTSPATQQPQTPPVNPTTPANNVGDGAQTKAGNPATPTGTTTPATTGVAGSAQTTEAQVPSGSANPMENSDLQGQIQNALSKEPTITGNPHVTVTGDTVELAGTVGSNKEKITASRIVQSYAGSKKLVNNLTITGRDDKNSIHTTSPNGGAQPITVPQNNPEPQKGSAPSATKPPQQ